MDEKNLKQALAKLQEEKKNFVQSYDVLVALKEINLKKPEEQTEFFAQLPHFPNRKQKVCALVDSHMRDDAKKVFDTVISLEEFDKYDKKKMRTIAGQHDWFVGQANIMPKIAASWGRVLGPRGKMPNPKAGCIVPPKAPLQPLYDRLQNTVKVTAKKQPNIQVMVGKQDMSEEQLTENIQYIYDQIVHHLPKEKDNIKHTALKLTMSKPIKL